MRTSLLLAATLLAGAARAAPVTLFPAIALSSDGGAVAAVEEAEPTAGDGPSVLVIHAVGGAVRAVTLPCAAAGECRVSAPTWAPDGKSLVFVVSRGDGGSDLDSVAAGGGAPTTLLHVEGLLDSPRYDARGRLAVLATLSAHKSLGRAEAGARLTGEIGAEVDEQRLALVEHGALKFVSPSDLYVYEYDFRPDGGFVATAAHGNGDDNWWIAHLVAIDPSGGVRDLFVPPPREQLNAPSVSPDGRSVAFIGGWMSDLGSVGGDAFTLRLDQAGAKPVDLTPGWKSTIRWLDWHCAGGLMAVTLTGDATTIQYLGQGAGGPVWSDQATLSAGPMARVSCGGGGIAAVRSSFTDPPEIVAGPAAHPAAITHANAGIAPRVTATSVRWRNEGRGVQGWLLSPVDAPAGKLPLIELVHGGPQSAATAAFIMPDSQAAALLAQGWRVFLPNYRGSFGQGEAFTTADIGDIGGGEWRDVLTGLDAAERAAPTDERRVGIMGGSWGGFMTMWAVTQTDRFRAAFSHAGVSDFLSEEGEAPQPGYDPVMFGARVVDNPGAYLKASPVMHVKHVRTPVLITVGERDLECPMPQSQEFDTALKALGVPESFVVYEGEGHHFAKPANRADETKRMVAWFKRWFH